MQAASMRIPRSLSMAAWSRHVNPRISRPSCVPVCRFWAGRLPHRHSARLDTTLPGPVSGRNLLLEQSVPTGIQQVDGKLRRATVNLNLAKELHARIRRKIAVTFGSVLGEPNLRAESVIERIRPERSSVNRS